MSFAPADLMPSLDYDSLFGGLVKLKQHARGHRVGTDAILLAACAPASEGLVIDAGAGVGAVGIAVALRMPRCRVELLDIDPSACNLAKENLALNGLTLRGSATAVDLLSASARRKAGIVDQRAELVLFNPPFYDPRRVRISSDPCKARAHVAGEGGVEAWVRMAVALAAAGGRLTAIHRADRVGDLLRAFEGRAGDLAVLPIYPRVGAAAHRVIVSGLKGSRAPLRLLSGLVLHDESGAFTDRAEAIHRGEALIDLL